jgi:hypothetical protein
VKKVIILFSLIFQIVSCQNKINNQTPNKFLSKVNASKEMYSKDSLSLILCIKKEIFYNRGGYNANFYDQSTPIIIDTIIYSPNLDKVVFFVIDSVENKKTYPKNLSQDKIDSMQKLASLPYDGYHYNGCAYIGEKNGDSFEVYDFFRIYLGKYKNIHNLKNRLRQVFLIEYSKVQEKGFEYNVDDKRFWDNSNVWDDMEKNKKTQQEFDELKKTSPENIYDPNDR